MPLFGLFGGEDDESSSEETNKVGNAAKNLFLMAVPLRRAGGKRPAIKGKKTFFFKNPTSIKLEGGRALLFFRDSLTKVSQCREVQLFCKS